MGLKLSQLNKVERDFNNLKTPKKGLSLSDLQNTSKKINVFHYIKNELANISNAYVLDLETYKLNSRIRTIQLYDIKEKIVHVFVNGDVEDQDKIKNDLNNHGFNVEFHIWNKERIMYEMKNSKIIVNDKDKLDINSPIDTEEGMFKEFIQFLKDKPKLLIGHNLAHFDLGIVGALVLHYKITGFKIHEYTVGSGKGNRRVAFSYSVTNNACERWWDDAERYNIIDTLMVGQSLELKSVALNSLSKDTEFQKKEIDYRVFENNVLQYEWVLYGIYDVLSIPQVYNNLIKMWKPALKNLKIEFKQSQRIPEHVLMKGAGSIAESYLNYLLDGGVSIETKDHLTKYYGGVARAWNTDLVVADDKKKIRYLDFTSFYPFSLRKQKVFDVLSGSCNRISNTPFSEIKDIYNDFLYSAVFEVQALEQTKVILETELEKNYNNMMGVGYLRSFDKDKRIADLEHQFAFCSMKRGDKIKLTKTEIEITKTFFPNAKIRILKIIDGIIPTDDKKSEEYIQLYSERQKLKEQDNDAEVGYKVLLNSCYGKLAESKGKFFNLACASAITGYCRVHILKTIFYAKSLKLDVVYTDTDSCYIHGELDVIKKVQDYAERFNEHPQRFNQRNLKDEGEDIVAFWAIKRKRYLKVIRKDNKNHIIIKGENGNRDIGWRDDLFRISCITDGCTDINEINKRIQKGNFKLSAPLLKVNEDSIEQLQNKVKTLKHQLKEIRTNLSVKQQRWVEFYDLIWGVIDADESGEYLADVEDTKTHYHSYFKKLCDYFKVNYDLNDTNTFLYLFEHLKADYNDTELLISLLSNLGKVDLSFIINNSEGVVEKLQRDIYSIERKLKGLTFDFEMMCRELYIKHPNKKISELLPIKSNAVITRMIGVHFKKSTGYEDGIYYSHIVKAWQKETGRDAYIGCFFDINRDYTFKEKQADDFKDWSIQYLSYASRDDKLPVINVDQYNKILERKINLDTIRIKTREGINLKSFDNDDDKRAITFKIMSLKRTSQSSRVLDIFGTAYIFRLQIPQDLDVNKIKILKSKGKDKEVYSNATLFLTGQFRIESALRINKIKMFLKDRDVFSIFRFISDLGVFAQKLVLNMLNQTTEAKSSGKIYQPLELNNFPRFTFCTQADVYQPVDKEYARKIHMASFDTLFYSAHINHFWNFKLLSYCELNVYHKNRSAENKIKKFKMQNFEKETFEYEMNEGDYRSEIKFKLQRNYYETLSYVFALGNINQEYFLDIISKDNLKEFRNVRKQFLMEFPANQKGYFRFNQRKCIVLIMVRGVMETSILFKIQVMHDDIFEKMIIPLEDTWVSNVCYPPNNESNVVRWDWEQDKMIKKDEIEDGELELMGFR
jgi:DNA polymerase elongation subunit (family B)